MPPLLMGRLLFVENHRKGDRRLCGGGERVAPLGNSAGCDIISADGEGLHCEVLCCEKSCPYWFD